MTPPFGVLSEEQTLDVALRGGSLARFGDGELRLALGGDAKRQAADPALARALQICLAKPGKALVCIPRPDPRCPKSGWWLEYEAAKYRALYTATVYGSAFISRPDSAPWIDTPAYWVSLASLWRDRHVVLVVGSDQSLVPQQLSGAASVALVTGPERDAWGSVDALLEEAGRALRPGGLVVLCLGPTATVMAWRLAQAGRQAVDLGHVGLYLRHQGVYMVTRHELISDEALALNCQLHERPKGFGGDGAKHAPAVLEYLAELKGTGVLDYGAGRCTLARELRTLGFTGALESYDPAVPAIARPPKPADLVVCTDVLEHVEPDKLERVLWHLYSLAKRAAFVAIATRRANAVMADGRNAHLIVEPASWWLERLIGSGWRVQKSASIGGREVWAWLLK